MHFVLGAMMLDDAHKGHMRQMLHDLSENQLTCSHDNSPALKARENALSQASYRHA
jgi:hypothetical protein